MKTCPKCQSQYTDDSLRFCLQDGTPLVTPQAAPTVSFSEHPTVVAVRPTNPPFSGFERRTEPDLTTQPVTKSRFLVVAVVVLTIVLLAFVGVGAWIVYNGGSPYSRTNPMLANANTDRPVTASKSRPDATSNKSVTTATPAATVADIAKIKTEVSDRIESWRTNLEALDLDAFMSNYADSIDYYNGRGTTRAAVRDDKQRAFVKFDSMKMTISNLKVTSGPGDSRAVAVFDKAWVFTNTAGDRNAGKVEQQMTLEKINGKWLITLEKDLKVIKRPS